jgi:hypothetical protein
MPEVSLSITGSKGIIEVNDDELKLKSTRGKSFTWYRHTLHDNVLSGVFYFKAKYLSGSDCGCLV